MSPIQKYLEMLTSNPGGGGMVPQSAVIWDTLLTAQSGARITGNIAEIGVYKGYGASLAAGYLAKGEQLVLVDRYFGLEHSIAAIQRVAGPDVASRIDFHIADSLELMRRHQQISNRSARFFHIDGEHSYDAVMNDLKLAVHWLATDGCIAVDDVFNFATPQVTHALFDFSRDPSNNVSVFLLAYNKAYLCFNRALGLYRDFAFRANEACISSGHETQICAGGFAFERTYVGISPAVNDDKYQLIGRFTSDRAEFLSPVNRF